MRDVLDELLAYCAVVLACAVALLVVVCVASLIGSLLGGHA